ncbi:hypothetical protein H6F44_21550 [Pseudanabaena sp. FACHB-1277]|uniref:Uncharacterized protein n=1 Tax=Pseudanabaena cinerea FACHB-1277 TaxID=2949581 RepID=A0A926UX66_9CYAN|nr:hypothetical protein [Pseudanabaena cinerea]MBD2152684.1 hypothetical protein [Pseudanabaena cinerea FACHB-1277]
MAVLLIGGVQLFMGLFGEYLGRIFDEVQQKSLYIVKQQQRFESMEKDSVSLTLLLGELRY